MTCKTCGARRFEDGTCDCHSITLYCDGSWSENKPDMSAWAVADEDGKLIAGVVFNWYTGPSIAMHVAAEPGRRWLNRDFLYRCFAYPFLQLNCNRVTGLVKVDNLDSQRFNEHLGFKKEGVIRQGAEDKTDFILYGMLKDECRWLELKR